MKYEDVFKLKKRLTDLFNQKRYDLFINEPEFQKAWKSYLSKHNIQILNHIPTRREDVWNNRAKTVVIVGKCFCLSVPIQLANNILAFNELPP